MNLQGHRHAAQPRRPSRGPYPHHHHGDVVRRAPLHRFAGQPVAGGFIAGVHGGLPFPALDLLILAGRRGGTAEQGCLSPPPPRASPRGGAAPQLPSGQALSPCRGAQGGPVPQGTPSSPHPQCSSHSSQSLGSSLTSRQDRMKFTASSGVKTLKRPSQANRMNLKHGESRNRRGSKLQNSLTVEVK